MTSVSSAVRGPSVPQTTLQAPHLDPVVGRVGVGVLHQRDEVVVVDLLLAVGERLEAHEDVVQLVVAQLIAELARASSAAPPARSACP